MKKFILIIFMFFIFPVHADNEDKKPLLNRFQHYVSAAWGNGEGGEGDDMRWRTFEIRIGSSAASNRRLDFVHYNEGHPENNHRDGFAIEPMFSVSINKKIRFEMGVGPYLSFNTTSRNQKQYDDKNLGILASAVIVYSYLRLEYNHVSIHGEHPSDAILIGIGTNFPEGDVASDKSVQIAIMGSNFKTNRNGTEAALGGQLEIKQCVGKNFALSIDLIEEGEDALVDRAGVATQAWYVWWARDNLALSSGAGPYFVWNEREAQETELDGLISIDVQQQVGNSENGVGLLLRFSRIITADDTDRDIFSCGIAKKF